MADKSETYVKTPDPIYLRVVTDLIGAVVHSTARPGRLPTVTQAMVVQAVEIASLIIECTPERGEPHSVKPTGKPKDE